MRGIDPRNKLKYQLVCFRSRQIHLSASPSSWRFQTCDHLSNSGRTGR